MSEGKAEVFKSFDDLGRHAEGGDQIDEKEEVKKLELVNELHEKLVEEGNLDQVQPASFYLNRTPEDKELFGGLEPIRYGKIEFRRGLGGKSNDEAGLAVQVGFVGRDGKQFTAEADGFIADKGVGLLEGETSKETERLEQILKEQSLSRSDVSLFVLRRVEGMKLSKMEIIDGLEGFPVQDPGAPMGKGTGEKRAPIEKDRRKFLEYLLEHPKTLFWSPVKEGAWHNDDHVIAFPKGFLFETPGVEKGESRFNNFATFIWKFSDQEVEQIAAEKNPKAKRELVKQIIKQVKSDPRSLQRKSFREQMGARRKYHGEGWYENIEKEIKALA